MRVCGYYPPGRSSFILTLRLASISAASTAACAFSRRRWRTAYSGLVSQWWASAFRAANSPARPERSRAVSLVTSFGSCGPTYAFLDLVAEVGIYAFYSHPAVRADLIIAPPAEIRSDEVLLLKSLERVVHRVVR